MKYVKFPCCGDKKGYTKFYVKLIPLSVDVRITFKGNNYYTNIVKDHATLSHKEYRDNLFDKAHEEFVTIICPNCSKEFKASQIEIVEICRYCKTEDNLIYLKDHGFSVCKECKERRGH